MDTSWGHEPLRVRPDQAARAADGGARSMTRQQGPSRSRTTLAVLLLFVGAVNVLCMPSIFWVGDPSAWREESRAMLRGELAVDSAFARNYGETGQYFVENASGAEPRWYSKYGVTNALMSLPPTLVDRWYNGAPRGAGEQPDLLIFNLYQVCLTLLVSWALFRLAGRYTTSDATRVIYVLAVLYATHLWYFQRAQSSEIYQVLFYLVWFGAFVRYLRAIRQSESTPAPSVRSSLLTAWTCAGVLVLTRVLYGLLLPVMLITTAVAIWGLGPTRRRITMIREAVHLVPSACLVILVLGWVNWLKFGSPLLTGYHVWHPEAHWARLDTWDGVYGYLFDMRASIFLYFPVLVFALAATRRFYRTHPIDTLVMWTSFGVFFLFLGKTPSWLGGWTYGPRYLLFALPVLSLPFLTWVDGILDGPWSMHNWLAATVTLATLTYSGYLTERQNRLDFFVHLRVSEPLEPFRDKATEHYFHGHHQGWISSDLIAHRQHVDRLPFMKDLDSWMPLADLTDYRRRLKVWTSRENYYWRRADHRLSMKR